MCMGVFLAGMSVQHLCARCLRKPERGVGSPATGVTDGCELHMNAGNQTGGPLEELPVLFGPFSSLLSQKMSSSKGHYYFLA